MVGMGPVAHVLFIAVAISSIRARIATAVHAVSAIGGVITVSSVIVGLLVANLLLLNEFPDVDADKKGGRMHLPILFGKRTTAIIYCIINVAAYVLLLAAAISGIMPYLALIGLITLPLSIKAMMGALRDYGDTKKLMPSLMMNVLVVQLTPLLMGIGIIVDKAV